MYKTIVVGTDGSPSAKGAVKRAAQLAKLCDARLLIVSAYKTSSPSMIAAIGGVATVGDIRGEVESMLNDEAAGYQRDGLKVETFAYPGSAADGILEIAEGEKCDLIVIGNRGMQGTRRYLGSVPNNVAHNAPCSVLIVSTS